METNPVIELFLALAVIIAAARIAGSLSRRYGQPRVFGQLLAGVILGPTLLNFLHWPVFTHASIIEAIPEFAELGVLLLMFNVGIDVDLSELIHEGRVGFLGGVAGALVPVLVSVPVVVAFGHSSNVALFAGVALAATSVSISAQTMLELGVLQTREGYSLLAMALVDDIIAILLVSFAVASTSGGESVQAGELAGIIVKMFLYIAVAGAVAWFALPPLFEYLSQREETTAAFGRAAFALILALLFGWSAEYLGGVAAITGAFIAGAGISRIDKVTKERIRDSMMAISYVFLMPIFFVNVGIQTDLKQIFTTDLGQFTLAAMPFTLVLMLVAVGTKVVGVFAGGRIGGLNNLQALRVGVGMVSRGEVGLIIASIGLTNGIFDDAFFPILFLVILASTVFTPPLLRLVFRQAVAET